MSMSTCLYMYMHVCVTMMPTFKIRYGILRIYVYSTVMRVMRGDDEGHGFRMKTCTHQK